MFWCTDDDRMEWLFDLNAYKLASFVSKALKKCQQGLFVQYCLLFMSLFGSLVVYFDQCLFVVILASCLSVFGV